jgi:hypothetical protein
MVHADPWQGVLDQLAELKQTWPGGEWSWDSRFAAVASSFGRDLEPSVRESIKHALSRGWTRKTIDTAPDGLRAITDRTGGLRQGQRLLAGDADTLFGLWWPWGGGDTITLRLGFAGLDANAAEVKRLRALFGV